MKLFRPDKANEYVFAVVADSAKEGTSPEYQLVKGLDADACLSSIAARRHKNAYRYPVGRYDGDGYYQTYLPPIPGAEGSRALGRFVTHPLAKEEQ